MKRINHNFDEIRNGTKIKNFVLNDLKARAIFDVPQYIVVFQLHEKVHRLIYPITRKTEIILNES